MAALGSYRLLWGGTGSLTRAEAAPGDQLVTPEALGRREKESLATMRGHRYCTADTTDLHMFGPVIRLILP